MFADDLLDEVHYLCVLYTGDIEKEVLRQGSKVEQVFMRCHQCG